MTAIPFLTKRKPSATRESGPSDYNPYLAARREWDERYGDQITRARNWRTMALLCSLTSLVACGGMIWLSVHSRVVPFIAVIDGLGRPIASGTGDQTTTADERLKKAVLLQWVEQLRSVTTDGVAQRKNNRPRLQPHREQQPRDVFRFGLLQSESAVCPCAEGDRERRGPVGSANQRTHDRNRVGGNNAGSLRSVKSTDHWKGTFTIAINPPSDERTARVNPLGIYVVSANWSRVLQ